MAELNVLNLNKLIAHLEAQPSERFNMRNYFTRSDRITGSQNARRDFHKCGTAACIAGHILVLDQSLPTGLFVGEAAGGWLGLRDRDRRNLFEPFGFNTQHRWPLWRAIATLKRLRDHYLATGEVKVDWGPEPGAEPAQPWTAPQAVETTPAPAPLTAPELPAEITALLRGGKTTERVS